MTIDDMIRSLQAKRTNLLGEHEEARLALVDLHDAERSNHEVSTSTVENLRSKKNRATADLDALGARIAELEKEKLADEAATRAQSIITPTNVRRPAYDKVARITSEARTYQAPNRYRSDSPSFLNDLYAYQVKRDPSAGARLERHGNEVMADDPNWNARAVTGTANVAGFTPPAYVVDLFAELARAGRPVANACSPMALPKTGMTVNMGRITTGSTVAAQSAEGVAVSNSNIDDTLYSPAVNTIAGYVDVSRQALERAELVETVTFADLASAYNTELDRQIIAADGTSGTHLGLLNVASTNLVTYTDATPTLVELWTKLASAAGQIMSSRFTGGTHWIMGPTEWAWMLSQTDSTGRPFIGAVGAQNALGSTSEHPFDYAGPRGNLMGLPVIVSGNVPTNLGGTTTETRIVCADMRDVMLFEDAGGAPVQLKFEESISSTLGVRLLVYGYSALAAGRQPKAISVIAGTGLITPAL